MLKNKYIYCSDCDSDLDGRNHIRSSENKIGWPIDFYKCHVCGTTTTDITFPKDAKLVKIEEIRCNPDKYLLKEGEYLSLECLK